MKRILVVDYASKIIYPFEDEEVTYVRLWPYRSFLMRCLMRAGLLLNFQHFLWQRRLRRINLTEFDLIILNQMPFPITAVRFFRERNASGKMVYLLWDTLFKLKAPRLSNPEKELADLLANRESWDYVVASFDRGDCEKYGLRYTNQFAPKIEGENAGEEINADVFFCGQDKDRLDEIREIDGNLTSLGITFCCWLLPRVPKRSILDYAPEDRRFIKEGKPTYPQVSYLEIVQQDLQCKAILDLVQEGQHGITWRPLEALFYKKKLITNFSEIKDYDFYRKENIFILGEDDESKLREFLDSPYVEVPEEIIRQYTFEGWLASVMAESE